MQYTCWNRQYCSGSRERVVPLCMQHASGYRGPTVKIIAGEKYGVAEDMGSMHSKRCQAGSTLLVAVVFYGSGAVLFF